MAKAKASEPRVLMKVTVSDRDHIQRIAKANGITGIQVVTSLVSKETGIAPSTATPPAAASDKGGQHNVIR